MTLRLASLIAVSALGVAAAAPAPELTWPGFRGHEMSGVAPKAKLPDTWSTTQNVKWSIPVAGNGWSSPLGELALSSPAIAGNALYIRTQSKLYKIAN